TTSLSNDYLVNIIRNILKEIFPHTFQMYESEIDGMVISVSKRFNYLRQEDIGRYLIRGASSFLDRGEEFDIISVLQEGIRANEEFNESIVDTDEDIKQRKRDEE